MGAPKISTAESAVMEALWRKSPLSAEEIAAEVAEPQGWTLATVKTLINRLLKKAAIGATPEGRRYLYHPLAPRADWLAAESKGLLDRLFDGRLAPMVSHLSQAKALTGDDIAALRKLIAEIDEEDAQ
ncbi:MAG: BlaI/MecI/CopY family transcriptional regulator [Phenylobacterium sp.]|uniref:BlaI/MecI/CopY family transcriptional regulator n=1 Tax=Phenylobacterium sp. TaxID=1871053 RepID=UPI001A4C959B|nr:BlaI/MecI/CopY family transcriptional regulator [Phenylobacterium sp.]MBL8555950.1 BlaI/MecI/CopY family transcriptional regulator [Phenylobacterium sp.]